MGAPKKLERLVGIWKLAYIAGKKLEAKVDAAKAKVVELLGELELERVETEHGPIGFQTKTTEDWQGLAREALDEATIAKLLPRFTTTSAKFIRAPGSWSSEAR